MENKNKHYFSFSPFDLEEGSAACRLQLSQGLAANLGGNIIGK
jgi:hypothetical protein